MNERKITRFRAFIFSFHPLLESKTLKTSDKQESVNVLGIKIATKKERKIDREGNKE